MSTESEVTVVHRPDLHRWEALLDGQVVGHADYQLSDGLATFTHTVVEPAQEGRGIASRLARSALDQVRQEGSRKVRPECSYIAGWIDHHPDYRDLLEH
ncbi:GNAT family N-acetyltransferase [Acidipropionibacterium thoenii]|uniref:GNAT family N-acetyltransferase n=1 Tax=Acidipropionibacterium thoenii TaxID=1751 RepID=UPI0004220724|nr:GNAT family N-acetyltransferase [Acidipropionibacterium thoenii]